jgi:hypothetical protein
MAHACAPRVSLATATVSAVARRPARASVARRGASSSIDSRRVSLSTRRDAPRSTTARAVPVADLAGIDTTGFDTMFLKALNVGLPLYGAVVGAIFIFGTIAKVAFPKKFDDAMYGAEAKKDVANIDLDNLSEEDVRGRAPQGGEALSAGRRMIQF